jgi:hypothetical protein
MFNFELLKKRIDQETLTAIAERSGVSIDTVARARDGENLSIKSLVAICRACDLEMRDLFSSEDSRKTEAAQVEMASV